MKRKYCHIIPPIWTVRHPDMAAAWITEHVRQQGYEVQLIDLNAELYNLEDRPLVKDCWPRTFVSMSPRAFTHALFERHEEYIRSRLLSAIDDGCQVFGVLLLDAGARFTGVMTAMLKEMAPDAHVVVGGTGSTSLFRLRRRYQGNPPMQHPVDLEMPADHGIDSWCLGEGEETIVELLQRLESGDDLRSIRGLVLTEDGPMATFKERPLLKDLSKLPHATYEGFDLSLYQFKSLPFQLSRGCAFARCSHCSLKGYSRGFRVREPDHALAELKYLVDRYGIRSFHFTDLNVNGDLERLEQFCDRLIEKGPEIEWQSFVQIRGDMTPRLMEKIVRSGCSSLNYGFESGSNKVLELMRKDYRAEEAAKVLRMTEEAGGNSIINLMVGHPGETEEEFQHTLDFLSDNAENIGMVASVSFTSVLIHSPLLDEFETFDIKVDSLGRWQSRDGELSRTVRNDRVHRVTELLRILAVPCFEAFWEPASDEDMAQGPAPSAEEEGVWARITDTRLYTPEGEIGEVMDTGDPLMVRVAYEAGNYALAAVDLSITDLDGRPIFFTEAASEAVRTHHLAETGWFQFVLRPFDLPEGDYLVSVRMRWPYSDRIFDRHAFRRVLRIRGPEVHVDPVETPYTWTHHLEPYPREQEGPIGLVRITDGMGDEPLILVHNQTCELLVVFMTAGADRMEARYRIFNMGCTLIHESEAEELPPGQEYLHRWDLSNLRLGMGKYLVEVEAANEEGVYSSQYHLDVGNALVQEERGREDLALWTQWEVPAVYTVEAEDDGPRLFMAEIHRKDDREGPISPGAHLTLVGTFVNLPRGIPNLTVRIWITDQENVIASEVTSSNISTPHGMVIMHCHMQINAPLGHYDLCCAMWCGAEARPFEPVWSFPLELIRR